jgi:hypothetical protein
MTRTGGLLCFWKEYFQGQNFKAIGKNDVAARNKCRELTNTEVSGRSWNFSA